MQPFKFDNNEIILLLSNCYNMMIKRSALFNLYTIY